MPVRNRFVAPAASGCRGFVILLALASLSAAACGVPISAGEITATAESGALAVQVELSSPEARLAVAGGTQVPTRAPATATATSTAGPTTRTPTSTLTATLTPTATSTPDPNATPTPSPAATATGSVSPTATSSPLPTATPGYSPQQAALLAADAVRLVNQSRNASNRSTLTISGTLTNVANAYAKLMAERNFFSHDGLDGSTPSSRIAASSYTGSFKGEALAAGQETSASVVTTWLNSPAHAAILLDGSAAEVGIGYYYSNTGSYRHYWVLVTGTQQ